MQPTDNFDFSLTTVAAMIVGGVFYIPLAVSTLLLF